MEQLEQRVHAAAASIIDPETGRHAEVFVRRTHQTGLMLTTRGSPAFARELEKRPLQRKPPTTRHASIWPTRLRIMRRWPSRSPKR